MIYGKIRPVLKWVYAGIRPRSRESAPQELLTLLNDLCWVEVPPHLGQALTGFRHRRQDARLAVCQRFIRELKR